MVKLTADHLSDVARVYRAAELNAKAPAAAVSEHFGTPRRTASYWIRLARERGHLSTDHESRSPKVLAVADAIGVDYEALRDAIITHAGGDLRIQ